MHGYPRRWLARGIDGTSTKWLRAAWLSYLPPLSSVAHHQGASANQPERRDKEEFVYRGIENQVRQLGGPRSDNVGQRGDSANHNPKGEEKPAES